MSQNLQNFDKFQKFQLDNFVDFEKCCKTRIFLQKSVPIQPKTSNILPKFCRSAVVSPTGAGRRTAHDLFVDVAELVRRPVLVHVLHLVEPHLGDGSVRKQARTLDLSVENEHTSGNREER